MGTNYYLMNGKHIGKESAAGLYCWDCETTLCKNGKEGIHQDTEWHDKCPSCDKKPNDKSPSAGLRQLGFFERNEVPLKKGVTTISSFSWAIDPIKLNNKRKVKNEYREVYTIQEFQKILINWCPVQYFDSIGEEFR